MTTFLTLFIRRNGRRAGQLVAPVMLLLGLSGFALAQMPYANTLWSQQLTITGDVNTAEYTPTATNTPVTPTATNTPVGNDCEGFITLTGKTESGNSTTYTYTFDRNDGDHCNDMSFIAFNVCFNPVIDGALGRITSTTQPSGWTYDPSNAQKLVKWNASGGFNAPLSGLTFSITINGTQGNGILGPDAQGGYQIHAGGGAPVYEIGKTVTVPHPVSCGSIAPLLPNGMSPNACLPLKLVNEPVREQDSLTKFSYRLTGGSASGKSDCPAIEVIILPVCFDPHLTPEGWVLDASTARDWRYAAQMEDKDATPVLERAATWKHAGERGPWNTSISFTAPGEDLPLVKVQAYGREASGAGHNLGEVEVPRPLTCDPATPTPTSTSTPPPPATATPEPGDGESVAETPTPEPTIEPTEEAAPTATSTPTPRPRNTLPDASPTSTPPNGGAVWWD